MSISLRKTGYTTQKSSQNDRSSYYSCEIKEGVQASFSLTIEPEVKGALPGAEKIEKSEKHTEKTEKKSEKASRPKKEKESDKLYKHQLSCRGLSV